MILASPYKSYDPRYHNSKNHDTDKTLRRISHKAKHLFHYLFHVDLVFGTNYSIILFLGLQELWNSPFAKIAMIT